VIPARGERQSNREELRARRPGLTLIEMMLVLALMTALGAMLWPALDGPFAAERLKNAADQLQADFAKARVAAMDSGNEHRLTLVVGERYYSVAAAADPTAAPTTFAADAAAQVAVPIWQRTLAEEHRISHAETELSPDQPLVQIIPGTVEIAFQADGTTSTARVVLSNDKGMTVDVRLRGLTGSSAVGEVSAAPIEALP
jgi:prepilin-type N-terminal cleavage/methylation domain-containing protein